MTPSSNFHDFREIKAQYLFEKEMSELRFPQYQDGSFKSNFKLAVFDYLSLLTTKSMLFFVPNRMKCSSYRNIFSPPIQDCCRHPHHVLPTMDWCQLHLLLLHSVLAEHWRDQQHFLDLSDLHPCERLLYSDLILHCREARSSPSTRLGCTRYAYLPIPRCHYW